MSTATYQNTQSTFSVTHLAVTVLLAGAVGLAAWEIWAKALAPFYMGGALSPVGLVKSSLGIGKETFDAIGKASSNATGTAIAQLIHLATGLIAFPAGYVLGARPIAKRVMPNLPWIVTGFVYGVALWVFAMYIMAHWFAGFPPFFNFNALSQASLIGHVALGLAIAGVVEARLKDG